MYKGKKIAVVMTCFNEVGKIGRSIKKIQTICEGLVDAIIVVDDGSTDTTYEEAKKSGVIVLQHPTNYGAGAGFRSGFLYTLDKKFDITVEMVGDDQDDPGDIKRLITVLVDECYDYVHGSRWLRGSHRINHPLTRAFLTRWYSLLFALCTGYRATDATNSLRAFRTDILTNPHIMLSQDWLNHYELEPYLYYKVVHLGYRVKEVPITKRYHKGIHNNTKMIPFISWWSIVRPLLYLRLGIKN